MNIEFKTLVLWLNANRLSLNIKKTNYMIFSPHKRASPDINLLINGENISRVYETKFLGVILDHKLSWNPHVRYIKNKISKTIGILFKARKSLGCKYLVSLYNTLVLPYLSYCLIVWGGANQTTLDPLIKMQKRALRCICNVNRRASTQELFKNTRILKLNDIYRYSQILFMYKFKKGLLPDIFNNLFTFNYEIHQHHTRQSSLIHVPKFKTLLSKNYIKYSGVLAWNNISNHVSDDVCIATFKKRVKTSILKHY